MFFDTPYVELNQKNYSLNPSGHAEFGLKSTLYLAYRDSKKLLTQHLFNRSSKTTYRICDYGCGAGLSTSIYAKIIKESGYNIEIVGLDVNEENLANARIKVPEGVFIKIDSNQSVESLGNFDLIICNFVLLEHPYIDMLEIIKKLQPLLEETGVLITTNTTRQTYKASNQWYSLNNDFLENIPLEPKGEKLILKEDQTVSLAVNDPEKENHYSSFLIFSIQEEHIEMHMLRLDFN